MKNEIYDLLHRGYFPKELPPAFNTYLFAVNYEEIDKEWNIIKVNTPSKVERKLGESTQNYEDRLRVFKDPVSVPTRYSYAKGRISRRCLSILNPVNYLSLALCVESNFQNVSDYFTQSPYSQSVPTYEINIHERCYRPSSRSVWALTYVKLLLSQGKMYEIKLDISQFYPSIYTHSITWAIVGKEIAKEFWRKYSDKNIPNAITSDEKLYNIANELDRLIQRCQDKQTHGIPIGPDSSYFVAEIIATYIDKQLSQSFPNLKGVRYYDDYTLFVDTKEDAAVVVYKLQNIIGNLGLSLNESKISISEAPKPFIEDYVEELSPFRFESTKVSSALKRYFNILWHLCDIQPYKATTIIKYGLHPLENDSLVIDISYKELFESLLYKTALVEPSALNQICELISKKGYTPTASSLTNLVEAVVKKHVSLNHHHEVSWALWILKKYNLSIDIALVKDVFHMHNPICTLLMLDYLNNKSAGNVLLTDADIQAEISSIENSLTDASLFNEDWILVYEGAYYGWLNTQTIVRTNPYFNYLYDKDISFYDVSDNADYSSYDYIEQLPANVYTQEMRKMAKEFKTKVMGDVYDQLFGEIMDDESLSPEKKQLLKSKYKIASKNLNLEKKLFEELLSQIFRRESLDYSPYVQKIIDKLSEIVRY